MSHPADDLPGAASQTTLIALLRVACATTLMVMSFSMLQPVLAVRLQAAGVSASAIGVLAMLPFMTVALMVPLMPQVFARLGVATAYRVGMSLEALATLGYAFTEHYALWCLLAVVGGIGAAAVWNGTEALIAHNAPPDRRGRFTGLYQSALGGAMAVGPFLPGLLRWSPHALTVFAATLMLASLAVTFGRGVSALQAGHEGALPAGLWATICSVPGLVTIAFAGGVFEAGLGSITTAYGSQSGLSLAAATSLAGALGLGSFALQYPCGWLSDHVSPRTVFGLAGVLLLSASAAFATATAWPPVLWICAFVWGAVGGALYTLTMIRVAHQFAASSAIAGTAAMITGYTVGGAVGPSFSGVMIDHFGAHGQAAWLSVLAVVVLVLSRRFSGRSGHG
ncbi:MAG: MFS transporter [Pseudomonadota bacterium]|nr:MFS transporter [Pseudomonadota bacterium]